MYIFYFFSILKLQFNFCHICVILLLLSETNCVYDYVYARKDKKTTGMRLINYGTFINYLFKYNCKFLTARNLFYTRYSKNGLLVLIYQVEVTIFPKIFLQKFMLSIQFYLFAHNSFFYHSVK